MPEKYKSNYKRPQDKNDFIGKAIMGLILLSMFGGLIESFLAFSIPLLTIGGIIFLVYTLITKSSSVKYDRPKIYRNSYSYKTSYNTVNYKQNRSRTQSYKRPLYSTIDINLVDKKLTDYFENNKSLPVINDVNLRLKGDAYISLKSLNVYMKDDYVCSFEEFGNKYTDIYDQIMNWLIAFAKERNTSGIFTESTSQSTKVNEPDGKATIDDFMKKIDDLNTEIPDEDISNGLYETNALLKQIGDIETKFPGKSEKLTKLYKYYLPMLISNLNQYKELQSAQTNENFQNTKLKLQKNVTLINEAMKTLAASLCEEDFINLSADISTLESLLRKDGLAGDNRMSAFKGGSSNE